MTGICASPLYAGPTDPGVVDVPDDEVVGLHSARWKLGADGFIYKNATKSYAWITPQSGMAAYEIKVTLASGDALEVSAGLGVWLSPVISPEWGYQGSGGGKSGEISIEIRKVSDLSLVDTATISLERSGTLSTTPGTGGSGSFDTVFE